jgi:hypothetical protein
MNTLLPKQSICNVRNLALMLMCSLMALTSYSQEGSWGNTYIGNSGAATFFGAHNFVTGGSGSQPGLIKTERTAPLGILYYSPDATYTGADDANHVDGYVAKTGTSSFTFPIGNGTKLRTAGISAPSAAGTFKAAYWFANPNSATLPAGGSFPVANLGTGVTGVSTAEYWDIDGPSAVDLTLTWDAASNLNTLSGGDLNNLIIVGYNSTTNLWESLGGTATGTLTGDGSVVATGVTPDNYSAFTFGSLEGLTTPDLRPYLVILNVDFTLPTITRPFSVRVRNMRAGTVATEPIVVRIYKPSPTSTIALTGAALTNWTITNSPTFYTLTSDLDVPEGTTGIVITGNITLPSTVLSGVHPMRVLIPNLSGGELISDNENNEIIGKLTRN